NISVGTAPAQVAIPRDGSRVYVTNTGSNSVSVIDRSALSVATTISLGARPSSIAVSPGRAWLYVLDATGVVELIDARRHAIVAATNAVTQTIDVFSLPGAIALTQDGSRAYAAIDYSWIDTGYGAGFFPGHFVAAIDTATNAVIDWIDLGADGADWTLQNKPA